jgi:hypothetical protein
MMSEIPPPGSPKEMLQLDVLRSIEEKLQSIDRSLDAIRIILGIGVIVAVVAAFVAVT